MGTRVVPSVEEITQAVREFDPVFAGSPLLRGTTLDDGGARVALKVETLNPIRSFKGRGAVTWVRKVAAEASGAVCVSAGNFGQGLAYAARAVGTPCHIFVDASANPSKVQAMRRLDAGVEVGGDDYDAVITTAQAFAERHGLRFVQDGRDPWIAAGAATMAVETTNSGVMPDVALVPVGNSALILGIARWLRHQRTATRVVGVCAEQAPAPALSWRQGIPAASAGTATVADGIGVREPFSESVAGMLEYVDDMVLVSEAQTPLDHPAAGRRPRPADRGGRRRGSRSTAGGARRLPQPAGIHSALRRPPPTEALQWGPDWRD